MVITDLQNSHDATEDAYDAAQREWAAVFDRFLLAQRRTMKVADSYRVALEQQTMAASEMTAVHARLQAAMAARLASSQVVRAAGPTRSRVDALLRRG